MTMEDRLNIQQVKRLTDQEDSCRPARVTVDTLYAHFNLNATKVYILCSLETHASLAKFSLQKKQKNCYTLLVPHQYVTRMAFKRHSKVDPAMPRHWVNLL